MRMPMENLRRIRGDCRALARRWGLPHREVSFSEAVWHTLAGMLRTSRRELARRARVDLSGNAHLGTHSSAAKQ